MKILFIPDYNNENPYLKTLADSLSKDGIKVNFGISPFLFSITRSVKNYGKPDLLHIHWAHWFILGNTKRMTILKSLSFVGEILILKLLRVKIIWTVHNIASHEGNFYSLELFFRKLLAGLCTKLIVHSSSAKDVVVSTYGAKVSTITVIPHGNYIDYYENVVSKTEARKQLQLSTEDITFLYFGQIRPYKGVSELIGAFKKLNCPQAKLLIAGKPLNNEVIPIIQKGCEGNENIKTFFGFISDNDIQIYMNAADVVVLPYREILTSGSVILAMSFGKPIIAPAIGGIRDVLDCDGSFLYNPSEEEGLRKALKHVLNTSVENLRLMGVHNFELAKQHRWDEIAKKTYDAYRECLKRHR